MPTQSYWMDNDLRSISESLGPEQLGQGMLEVDALVAACDLLKRGLDAAKQCQVRLDSVASEEAQQLINTFESTRMEIAERLDK